ncbi:MULTISPECIES: hypothetical protein [Ramlibacter]|nr:MULTISPECIES: hypothetical protein [Ramlibacter]
MDLANLPLGDLLPTPWGFAAMVVFSIAGIVGWRHGRREKKPAPKWLGLALMLYPYGVSGDVMLWVVGAALTAAMVLLWDR